METRWFRGGMLVVASALLSGAAAAQQAEQQEPRRTDLVETTERRLVQVDVTVKGDRGVISDLRKEDFRLAVGFDKVPEFILDNLCVLPDEDPTQTVEVVVEEPTEALPAVPRQTLPNFLFYFDQHHLTMAGRANSIDTARELITELIGGGNRGMIVSAGKELRTFSELTDDPGRLLEALTELNGDSRQWDPWVQQEESRIGEILQILNDPSDTVTRAFGLARQHQREERWRTQKALHLFSIVLGRMSELDPPKAVVYFADTMRREAGKHYLSFFARRTENSDGDARFQQAFDASHAFDRVIEEATGMGIRVFTVEARGLMSAPNWALTSETAAGTSSPVANTQSIRDAQNSLVGMAQETGGRSFLNGMRARKIAAQIQQDLSCVYLLSFDASHLRQNTSHRLVVNVDRPGVKVHARGQVTVQSESRRLTSQLMAAFASPEAAQSQFPVRGVVVPTGYDDGKYSALVQLRAPGSPLPASSWDLGLSLISRGEVAADTSGRISVNGPGVPVVLETEMAFKPGPFKLVGVAHETTGNDVGTGEIEDDWPDPDEAPVTLGPIAIMQPAAAAILRDDELRRDGAVGVGEAGLARADRPSAVIGIVCRAKNKKGKLRLERKLTGEGDSSAPFGPMNLDFGKDRCIQYRDIIPPGSMSSGMFRYEVAVYDKDEELASKVREFAAATADEHPDTMRSAMSSTPAAADDDRDSGVSNKIDPLQR